MASFIFVKVQVIFKQLIPQKNATQPHHQLNQVIFLMIQELMQNAKFKANI